MEKGWVLITGVTSPIGRAVALELSKFGWSIIGHYHKNEEAAQKLAEEIQDSDADACLAEIDLSNAELAESLIPALAEQVGLIDGLVNCAATRDEATAQAVNADAPRLLAKALRDHLPKGDRAAVVNILDASVEGQTTAYATSKDALRTLTLNMAKSFAPQVHVNAVAAQSPVNAEAVAAAVRRFMESTSVFGEITKL